MALSFYASNRRSVDHHLITRNGTLSTDQRNWMHESLFRRNFSGCWVSLRQCAAELSLLLYTTGVIKNQVMGYTHLPEDPWAKVRHSQRCSLISTNITPAILTHVINVIFIFWDPFTLHSFVTRWVWAFFKIVFFFFLIGPGTMQGFTFQPVETDDLLSVWWQLIIFIFTQSEMIWLAPNMRTGSQCSDSN